MAIIPQALNTLSACLGVVISIFDPVKEWIVGANRGYIIVRSIKGMSFDNTDEITGLGLLLYSALAGYGCKGVEVTSFTGIRALAVNVVGNEDDDFTILSEKNNDAPIGILIRDTFNEGEKEAGEIPKDENSLLMAIRPLIDAHGPYFPLPELYLNGNRVDVKVLEMQNIID